MKTLHSWVWKRETNPKCVFVAKCMVNKSQCPTGVKCDLTSWYRTKIDKKGHYSFTITTYRRVKMSYVHSKALQMNIGCWKSIRLKRLSWNPVQRGEGGAILHNLGLRKLYSIFFKATVQKICKPEFLAKFYNKDTMKSHRQWKDTMSFFFSWKW